VVGARVLITSENAAQRHELWLWLLPVGCDLTVATDFKTGKRLVQTEPPDLLITDLRLGAYNGLHLVILGQHRDPGMKAIVIGSPDPVLENETRAVGACYLTQPFDQAGFLKTVVEALHSTRPGRRTPRKRIAPIEVLVEGMTGRIVDVSYEGLCLEVAGEKDSQLPQTFTIRIPSTPLALAARRVWSIARSGDPAVVSYGIHLGLMDPGMSALWRSLVDSASGSTIMLT
jgi:DNA-binding response OmpR family regulator